MAHLLPNFGWNQFDHPPQSPDLATLVSTSSFFASNPFLGGQKFNSRDELKEHVTRWLTTQAVTFYEEGAPKLVPRYYRGPKNAEDMKKRS